MLKPGERDPSASLFMAHCLKEESFLDAVFNGVLGDKLVVDAPLEQPSFGVWKRGLFCDNHGFGEEDLRFVSSKRKR